MNVTISLWEIFQGAFMVGFGYNLGKYVVGLIDVTIASFID